MIEIIWETVMPGQKQTLEIPWHETRILNCFFCGRMISRIYWEDDEFPCQKFCEESCAELKRSLNDNANSRE